MTSMVNPLKLNAVPSTVHARNTPAVAARPMLASKTPAARIPQNIARGKGERSPSVANPTTVMAMKAIAGRTQANDPIMALRYAPSRTTDDAMGEYFASVTGAASDNASDQCWPGPLKVMD